MTVFLGETKHPIWERDCQNPAYGLMTGIWTSTTIAEVIEWEFNIKYHPGHVRKLLQDFGFSVQSPKRLLAAADKERRDRWVSETYPDIKKKLDQKAPESFSKTKQDSDKTRHSTELGPALDNNRKSPS